MLINKFNKHPEFTVFNLKRRSLSLLGTLFGFPETLDDLIVNVHQLSPKGPAGSTKYGTRSLIFFSKFALGLCSYFKLVLVGLFLNTNKAKNILKCKQGVGLYLSQRNAPSRLVGCSTVDIVLILGLFSHYLNGYSFAS